MGVTPIEYRPWDGKRTDYWRRFLVISNNVFRQKLKSKWVLALLIIGVILVHVFSIIFISVSPHEKLEPEMMVGEEFDNEPSGRNMITVMGNVEIHESTYIIGELEIDGTVRTSSGGFDLQGELIGSGTVEAYGTVFVNDNITDNGSIQVIGSLSLFGRLEIDGRLNGSVTVGGEEAEISGSGRVIGEFVEEESEFINERYGGYLTNGGLVIFTILLASLVCSDLIAEDLGDNSFILYFSRPIKSYDYLTGKILGALWVLGLFCFLPPMIFCIAGMGTQSSTDYGISLNVLGSTFVAGLLTTFILVPYGILISSLTKRKAYAAIGIFMTFFVLTIIGQLFSNFDKNWILIDPTRILFYSYYVLYGFSLPEGVNGTLLGAILFCILVIPLVALYLRIHLKGVGK